MSIITIFVDDGDGHCVLSSYGKTQLPWNTSVPHGGRAFRRKRLRCNLFLNVLREASPLAAFRRKRTSFGKLHLWRLSEGSELVSVLRLPPEGRASFASFGKLHLWRGGASFGKVHLWRGGGFPKEAEGSELVLKKARPSAF